MSGPWYLGIDGGQTRTRAVVADATGQVVGRGVGGPSNHVEAPGGRDRLRAGVSDSVAAALQQAGLPVLAEIAFASVYCGMTGEADYKHEVIAPLLRTSALLVEHDAPAALAGATVGEAGIIAIAGTGSVVYGETSSGERARTGGWGYLFGDEGSGFGLARDAVRAALDALDDVGPETALVAALSARFATPDLRELPMAMYNGHVSRDALAAAARDVLTVWLDGDHVADRVVHEGLDALARRVDAVARRLGMTDPLVCLSGGVFTSMPYADAFAIHVRHHLPEARVAPAQLSAAAGAVLLAYRAGGVPITETLKAQLAGSAREADDT